MTPSIIRLIVLLILTAALGGNARASIEIFLKLDGIPGDALDGTGTHGGEIVAQTCDFKVDQSAINWAGGTASASRSNITPITVGKLLDSASPLLFVNSLIGKTSNRAVLTFRNRGSNTTPFEYLTITLTDVVVCNYDFAASTASTGVESVSLSYKTITFRYVPQTAAGTAGTPIERTFNVLTNR